MIVGDVLECYIVFQSSRQSISVEGGGDATSPGKPITPPWEVRWCLAVQEVV